MSRKSSTNLQLLEPVVLNLNFRVRLGDSEFAWLSSSYLVLVYVCFCHSNAARTAFTHALLSAYTVHKDDITVIGRLENNLKYCSFVL